jgi:hypothetical protein
LYRVLYLHERTRSTTARTPQFSENIRYSGHQRSAWAIPFGAGVAMFMDPLRRKSNLKGGAVKVATLDALPPDGIPRKFPVVASRVDAWKQIQ